MTVQVEMQSSPGASQGAIKTQAHIANQQANLRSMILKPNLQGNN